jgi:hypothetical protein
MCFAENVEDRCLRIAAERGGELSNHDVPFVVRLEDGFDIRLLGLFVLNRFCYGRLGFHSFSEGCVGRQPYPLEAGWCQLEGCGLRVDAEQAKICGGGRCCGDRPSQNDFAFWL